MIGFFRARPEMAGSVLLAIINLLEAEISVPLGRSASETGEVGWYGNADGVAGSRRRACH